MTTDVLIFLFFIVLVIATREGPFKQQDKETLTNISIVTIITVVHI